MNNQQNKEIPFEVLESEGIKIEDIEEFLYQENIFRVFKISLDYEKSVMIVKYILKGVDFFPQEQVEYIRSKVTELRSKIKTFAKKIDELIA